jgi:hypothetical protein
MPRTCSTERAHLVPRHPLSLDFPFRVPPGHLIGADELGRHKRTGPRPFSNRRSSSVSGMLRRAAQPRRLSSIAGTVAYRIFIGNAAKPGCRTGVYIVVRSPQEWGNTATKNQMSCGACQLA